jgi:hypothetical protein
MILEAMRDEETVVALDVEARRPQLLRALGGPC